MESRKAKEFIRLNLPSVSAIGMYSAKECREYAMKAVELAEEEIREKVIEAHSEGCQWISVEERYPEYDSNLPLTGRERFIVRVVYGSAETKINYTLAWMNGRTRFNVEMDWVKVTHWMPMPKFEE